MTIYRHNPSGLARNTRYRVFDSPQARTPASIQSPHESRDIPDGLVTSNLLAEVDFQSEEPVLHLKELGMRDDPTGVLLTSTGRATAGVVHPSRTR